MKWDNELLATTLGQMGQTRRGGYLREGRKRRTIESSTSAAARDESETKAIGSSFAMIKMSRHFLPTKKRDDGGVAKPN